MQFSLVIFSIEQVNRLEQLNWGGMNIIALSIHAKMYLGGEGTSEEDDLNTMVPSDFIFRTQIEEDSFKEKDLYDFDTIW